MPRPLPLPKTVDQRRFPLPLPLLHSPRAKLSEQAKARGLGRLEGRFKFRDGLLDVGHINLLLLESEGSVSGWQPAFGWQGPGFSGATKASKKRNNHHFTIHQT